MSEVWAIILAGGESKRMGTPKMLLPYRGATIIETVIQNIASSSVEKTLVVLGSNGDQILEAISEYPVMHCYNDAYKSGMLSSVKCGFAHLPDECGAALVFPGDQPMIREKDINIVLSAWHESGKGIVVPTFRGRRGHPLLIDRKYRQEVMTLDESDGLRALAMKHPGDVREIETDNPLILKDIDTAEDYRNELNRTI
jgi:molybdenum cofactor cytidylyltransferase